MEVWKTIKDNSSHMVSSKGRIRSIARVVHRKNGTDQRLKEKILKPIIIFDDYEQYHRTGLKINDKRSLHLVHLLVANHFIPNPDNLKYVCHIDGDLQNNNFENLIWSNESEKYSDNNGMRLTKAEIKQIRHLISSGERAVCVAKIFSVTVSTIYHVKNFRTWKNV